eukprot:CAMPEP_0183304328 /NCGR_PEP_ID=MMETSP0160_2-20130417/9449_1 /TAXON_ID=2839 ORGANISM="Odontella Sinensis, Strain Grunow 1884" /NCGR_SAMPLE_ID=MMETSP0160_2 /ASSEMBLY_ACC=CAM_ASM_000250 /LENGTH=160 /DNA_ID=CAMNT_0025467357 /DNA_START=77 /DNA_END=560 /DNA_ORIENTATION=+
MRTTMLRQSVAFVVWAVSLFQLTSAFHVSPFLKASARGRSILVPSHHNLDRDLRLGAGKNPFGAGGGEKISKARKEQLGIGDDEDEYDLGLALDTNTDPFITKVIAGSLILVIIGLLVAGVIIPSLTDLVRVFAALSRMQEDADNWNIHMGIQKKNTIPT